MTPSGWHDPSVQGAKLLGVRSVDQRLASAQMHQPRPLPKASRGGGRVKKSTVPNSQGAAAVGFCYLSELF